MMLAVLFLRTETSEDSNMPLVWVSKPCSMVLSDEGNASGEVRMLGIFPSTVVREHLALSPLNHCYSLRKKLDDTNILTHA